MPEETDESVCWLELLSGARIVEQEVLAPLLREGGELVAILVAILNTARGNQA